MAQSGSCSPIMDSGRRPNFLCPLSDEVFELLKPHINYPALLPDRGFLDVYVAQGPKFG